MKYNQMFFMSDILGYNTDDIIRLSAIKHIDTMIVAVPLRADQERFGEFTKKLTDLDIPYDYFLPNFDKLSFEYMLSQAATIASNRIWIRIVEGKVNYEAKYLREIMNSKGVKDKELVIISQPPYFFRPGSLTKRILEVSGKLDISVSPIVPLDIKPADTNYIKKAILTLSENYKVIPSLYYAKSNNDDENSEEAVAHYLNNSILPYCNEVSLLNWAGTISPHFNVIYSKIYKPAPKNPERIEPTMAPTKKTTKKAAFPRSMIVISKTLGMRKSPSRGSDIIGNLRFNDVVMVKSIFSDMDGSVYAEIIPNQHQGETPYYVMAEYKGVKQLQNYEAYEPETRSK